jgi:hypothetical protein
MGKIVHKNTADPYWQHFSLEVPLPQVVTTHMHPHIFLGRHTNMHVHICKSLTHMCMHIHQCTWTRRYRHSHMCTHMEANAYLVTHAYIHTHTEAQPYPLYPSYFEFWNSRLSLILISGEVSTRSCPSPSTCSHDHSPARYLYWRGKGDLQPWVLGCRTAVLQLVKVLIGWFVSRKGLFRALCLWSSPCQTSQCHNLVNFGPLRSQCQGTQVFY